MTIIKNLMFPNSPFSAYEETQGQADTAVVEGWTGQSFRNARRTAQPWRFRITLGGPGFTPSSLEYTAYRAVTEAVQGRLYGFKFTSPITDDVFDVAFLADSYPMTVSPGFDWPADAIVQCAVEFEQVIGGIPE